MIAALRSYAFAAFLALLLIVMGILLLPITLFGKSAVRPIAKLWTRIGLGALKLIAGVSYRVEGEEHLPKSGAVVAANHQSMWETLALYALLPKPVMVFKKELLDIPLYGWWAKAAGNIAVDRKGGARALKAMRRAASEAIANGEQIIVFPEGTRLETGETAPFQPGVAGIYQGAGAPCAPVAHDSGRFWRPGNKLIPGKITLRFLPALPSGLDRKTFMRELKTAIENARPDLARAQSANRERAHG